MYGFGDDEMFSHLLPHLIFTQALRDKNDAYCSPHLPDKEAAGRQVAFRGMW